MKWNEITRLRDNICYFIADRNWRLRDHLFHCFSAFIKWNRIKKKLEETKWNKNAVQQVYVIRYDRFRFARNFFSLRRTIFIRLFSSLCSWIKFYLKMYKKNKKQLNFALKQSYRTMQQDLSNFCWMEFVNWSQIPRTATVVLCASVCCTLCDCLKSKRKIPLNKCQKYAFFVDSISFSIGRNNTQFESWPFELLCKSREKCFSWTNSLCFFDRCHSIGEHDTIDWLSFALLCGTKCIRLTHDDRK